MSSKNRERVEDDSGLSLLFSTPHKFRVAYKINPYMQDDVNPDAAFDQWKGVVEAVQRYADVTSVDYTLDPHRGGVPITDLPDSVFVANHALPVPGENTFILSRMRHEEREGEVAYFKRWATENGYDIVELPDGIAFEGGGDGKWHPGRDVLWLGYGQRTEWAAVEELAVQLDADVIPLELVSEEFYHLDVCFTPLDPDCVLIIEDAFTPDGIERIESEFTTVLRVPEEDYSTMGGNCARIRPGVIAIDERNTATIELLEAHGFMVQPVDTSEFQKSGGSIDCLFLQLP